MKIRNNYLFFAILFFVLLTIFSLQIPFFWDGTFFSEIAVNIYDHGFNQLIDVKQPDTGGFPMYPVYLDVIWKCFGKTLAVSHLALLPFLAGICIEYFKLVNRFIKREYLPLAFLLLIAEPVMATQSILMGYDILMVYFFLLALNAILLEKKMLFSIALVLLCLSSMRGIFAGTALFFISLLIKEKISLRSAIVFIPAIAAVFTWALIHHSQTGWYFFSPERAATHEAILPPLSALKQFAYISWKVNDLGHLALWLFAAAMLFKLRAVKHPDKALLLKLLIIPLFTFILFMVPFANPVGPKYFIPIFLMLNIFCCYSLQFIVSKKIRAALISLLMLSLLSGNFWMYPERFGNAWDSSLKVLPYFHMKEQMDKYIVDNKIDPHKVGTQYPLIADKRFSHLSDTSFAYTNVWSGPVSEYEYYLQTNVINTDIPEQIENVKSNWHLLKRLECGQVNISLYKNPSY